MTLSSPPSSNPTCPLSEVIINSELSKRPKREPNYEAETRALRVLVVELAGSPRTILQKLVEQALILSGAQSTGVSLAETHEGQEIFRWHAIAGRLAAFQNGTMPRHFSPCGVVVDQDETLLMKQPIRHWAYIEGLGIHLEEVLLIPFHQNGKPIGTIWAVAHDTSKRFDAEDRRVLMAMAEFAAAAVQAQRQTVELKEERDLREKFVNAVIHDMRTPLTVSKMSAQLLARKLGNDSSHLKTLGRITDGIDRAGRMIQNMLDADRIKAGQGIPIQAETCDLSEVVTQSIQLLSIAHGQRFVVVGDDSPVTGTFDPEAISRVIENLCANAVKYGSDDSLVTVTLDSDPKQVQLSVHNHGPHIAPEEISTLLEPYRRASAALARGKQGWGIGLTLVNGIAQAHGGSIHIDSRPVEGTTFTVRLPR